MIDEQISEILNGTILKIQRMSTEDGPGIRSTVFFKGCPLKCRWCHNPESISPDVEIHWVGSRCIGCKSCIDACPSGALSLGEAGIVINRRVCNQCLACTKACPSTAMEALGSRWTLKELFEEVVKDRVYFEKSHGGVTISGGEPTMQTPFAIHLLKSLKKSGVHTTVDTCGHCTRKSLDMILPYTDLVLFDLKEIDPIKHKSFTGVTNERILDNLIHLAEYLKTCENPPELWIRTPIIPYLTATKDNIRGIGDFIRTHLDSLVSRWELCAFNNLCANKYESLGITWECRGFDLMTAEDMQDLREVAVSSGVDPDIVVTSGATRTEPPPDGQKDKPQFNLIKDGVKI